MSAKNDTSTQTKATTATGKPRSSHHQPLVARTLHVTTSRRHQCPEWAVAATIALLPAPLYHEACRRYPEAVIRLANKWRVRLARSNGKHETKVRRSPAMTAPSADGVASSERYAAVPHWYSALPVKGRNIFRDKDGSVYLLDDTGIHLSRSPKPRWIVPNESWGGRYRRRGAIYRFGWIASPSITPKKVPNDR